MFWGNGKKKLLSPVSSTGSAFSIGGTGPSGEIDGGSVEAAAQNSAPDSYRKDLKSRKVSGSYVVPAGYRITGPVFTSRPIRVDGELLGRALVAREVVVSRGGTLREPAEVERIVIEGRVLGSIKAREVVELRPGGELHGDVETPSLQVSPGGILSDCTLSVGL